MHSVLGTSRLTDQSVALVIKALAIQVGLDPARHAGHSLRAQWIFLRWPTNRATSHSICCVTMYVIRIGPCSLKVCFSIASLNDLFFRATILLSSGHRRRRTFPF
jgi:hypothetical protein